MSHSVETWIRRGMQSISHSIQARPLPPPPHPSSLLFPPSLSLCPCSVQQAVEGYWHSHFLSSSSLLLPSSQPPSSAFMGPCFGRVPPSLRPALFQRGSAIGEGLSLCMVIQDFKEICRRDRRLHSHKVRTQRETLSFLKRRTEGNTELKDQEIDIDIYRSMLGLWMNQV